MFRMNNMNVWNLAEKAYSRVSLDAVVLSALLFVLLAPRAHAYIDATTGSYLFESLLGGLLMLSFSIKVMWRNLKMRLQTKSHGQSS